VVDTTFVNYEDNDTRKTGAISNLLFSSFGVSTNNAFENVEFVDAKPVYFPPMESKWGSDNGGSTSFTTAAYRDRDGSLGRGPDSYVLIHDGVNDSIAVDTEACDIHPDWNAAVCEGDIGRLVVGGAGGGGGRGGFGGGRGGVPAGGGPAGRGGRGGGAPAEPVILSRNGQEYDRTTTNVRAGTEITVTTQRPDVTLTLNEMDEGSWVIFELPGFTTAASGAQQDSLDALRMASDTSYFQAQNALWVKVVSGGDTRRGAPGGGTSVNVSR
jgi:cell migration-inducing and hyaluronan-binding protein